MKIFILLTTDPVDLRYKQIIVALALGRDPSAWQCLLSRESITDSFK